MDTKDLPFPKHPIRQANKAAKQAAAKAFREAVWIRDGGRDRANGAVLLKAGNTMRESGNVCHLQSRQSHADRKTDPTNAVLLSDYHHILSDHRGGRLLRLTDPETGAPAMDGSKPIRFTLFDTRGKVVWERVS